MGFFSQFQSFLYASVLAGTPLLFGTLGEILTEKSGSLNLGVEGMMYIGAISGYYAAMVLNSPWLALLAGFAAGMLAAFIFAFLTVTLRANQNVTGLTLTVFGTGVANFVGQNIKFAASEPLLMSQRVRDALLPLHLGFLTELPAVGRLLFNHSLLTYLAVGLAVAFSLYLNRTRRGLNMRAIGENPGAADAMGVNVSRYKYAHIMAGGGVCALGGVYIALVTCVGNWQPNIVSGQGWIAVALVIFASWKPLRALTGSLVFGALSVLRLYVPASLVAIPAPIFAMLPFIVTCIVLVASSVRMRKENQQPAACGLNYFREER
jgi:simple sugar transport system permease protein